MKKSILLVAVVVLSAGILIACEKSKPTAEPTATPTVAPTETSTPTPAPTNTSTPTPTAEPTNTSTPTPTVEPTATPTPTVAPTNTPTPTEIPVGEKPCVQVTKQEPVAATTEKQPGKDKYGDSKYDYITYTQRFDFVGKENGEVLGYALLTYDQYADALKDGKLSAFADSFELFFDGEKRASWSIAESGLANNGYLEYQGSFMNKAEKFSVSANNKTLEIRCDAAGLVISNGYFDLENIRIDTQGLYINDHTGGESFYSYNIYPAMAGRPTVYKVENFFNVNEGWNSFIYQNQTNHDLLLKRNQSYFLSDGTCILDYDDLYKKNETLIDAAKQKAYTELLSRAQNETGEVKLTETFAEDAYGKFELTTRALLYKGEDGKTQIAGGYRLVYTTFDNYSYVWNSYIDVPLAGNYAVTDKYVYIYSKVDTFLNEEKTFSSPETTYTTMYKVSNKVTAYTLDGAFAGSYEDELYPLDGYISLGSFISRKLVGPEGNVVYEVAEDGTTTMNFDSDISQLLASGTQFNEERMLGGLKLRLYTWGANNDFAFDIYTESSNGFFSLFRQVK